LPAFRNDSMSVVLRPTPCIYKVEVLYICHKKGFRIVEVPVNWTDIPGTKVRLIRDSLRMFKDVVKIRLNDWRGVYQERPKDIRPAT